MRALPLIAELSAVLAEPGRHRVLTGDRPTGPLHVGHHFGTLRNRVALQRNGFDVQVVIADYQVITDRVETGQVAANVRELVLDYLAVGLHPERTTVFRHSAVPEIGQLMLPLLSAVTSPELHRNPTVKAEARDAGIRAVSGLLLTYPVHQAADVLAVGGTLVPVGEDQLPHVEQTRVVARRITERYGAGTDLLRAPQALLGDAPRLLGIDGRKMAKSRGNAIPIGASEDQTSGLIRRAVTDSIRAITYDPVARPQVASLLTLAGLCTGRTPEQVADGLGTGGAVRLKAAVTEAVNEYFRPIRLRRKEFAADRAVVGDLLAGGLTRARPLAAATLARVHEAMGLS
jgi:tryptophanyl-tRNA synthetase